MNVIKKWIAPKIVWGMLLLLLIQNYRTCFLDLQNLGSFGNFQMDSEQLVTNMLEAEREGLEIDKYGLGRYIDSGEVISPYKAQVGLHGKVFRHLTSELKYQNAVRLLHFLCVLGMGITIILIVWILYKKYNFLMAAVFYTTFLLSPWIVNFARNLYWVECLWFLPMLIGLFCSYKIHDKKCRFFCYATSFLAIMIKALCGYEYITTIMLGLIAFLLIDLLKSFFAKDQENTKLFFRTTVIVGIMALAGFCVAICLHANFRGNGKILEGIKSIYENDVLRRTLGGNVDKFPEVYRESLEATILETIKKYFEFRTEIITGISGNLFSILCIAPMATFIYDAYKKRINIELISMYVIFFLVSISWFVLGKAHSVIHTHTNYVLWYFGFVQICLYIICNWLKNALKNKG